MLQCAFPRREAAGAAARLLYARTALAWCFQRERSYAHVPLISMPGTAVMATAIRLSTATMNARPLRNWS